MDPLTRIWSAVRRFVAEQTEIQERRLLLNRPWEEEFLHWVGEGDNRRLHGHIPPPEFRQGFSVTRGGWCPGLRREARHEIQDSPQSDPPAAMS